MKNKLISILTKTTTWYYLTNGIIFLFADKLTLVYAYCSFFITSIIFGVVALIKISEKEKVQINLYVVDEQRLKRIEEKLGLKNKFD